MDDTLKKLGITINYQKLKMKMVSVTLGWSAIIILLTSLDIYALKKNNWDILLTIFIPFLRNYCGYINFIGDLVIVTILKLVHILFKQIQLPIFLFTFDIIHIFI